MKLFSDPSDFHKVFDAIIVGTGLTGGWAAKELAEAGVEVLLLDAGPLLPPTAVMNTSWWNGKRQKQASKRQTTQSRHSAWWRSNPELFVDDIDNPYTTDTDFVWIRGRQVGGQSLTWGGVTLRFSDHEFLAPERDGFGARWPIRYSDLDPYYTKVERFLRVQGSEEHLEQFPDGYFALPPNLTETEESFKMSVESRWPHRKVVVCRGVPDGNGVDWPPHSSLHATLPAAFATGRATLRPDSVVSHLTFSPDDNSVNGVACVDRVTNQTFEVSGRTVCLCASAIESVRIMLNSKDPHHPDGVGNSSGLLGKYLVDHMAIGLNGFVPRSSMLPTYPIGSANAICIPKFRNVHEPGSSFVRGYGCWGGMQRGMGRASARDDAPWFLVLFLEVLPQLTNSVGLEPGKADAWGIPTVRVHFAYGENEQRMKVDALRSMLEMTEVIPLEVGKIDITQPGQYAHVLGGARMGSNPNSSVLDPYNRCWDATNLLVLDGACFVTSGWQDPRLTMMAVAARACGKLQAFIRGMGVKR